MSVATPLLAQSSGGTDYRSLYFDAVEEYEDGDHDRSLALLQRIERGLGGTNLRIQPYIVLNMIALERSKQEIMEEIEQYERLDPPDSAFTAVIEERLDRMQRDERTVFQGVERDDSADSYRGYLETYPRGRFAARARQRLDALEREAYTRVEQNPGTGAARDYLDTWPRGRFRREIGDLLFDHARDQGREGEWRAASATIHFALEQRLLPRSAETAAFEDAVEEGVVWQRYREQRTMENARNYLSRYPNGEYGPIIAANLAFTADQTHERYMETFGVDEMDETIHWHEVYLDWFPDGEDAARLETRLDGLTRTEEMVRMPTIIAVPLRFGTEINPVPNRLPSVDSFSTFTAGFGFGTVSDVTMFFIEAALAQGTGLDYLYDADDERYLEHGVLVDDGDAFAVPVDDVVYTDTPPFLVSMTLGFPIFGATILGIEGGVVAGFGGSPYRLVDVYSRYDQSFQGRVYMRTSDTLIDPVAGVSINQYIYQPGGPSMVLGLGTSARIRDLSAGVVTFDVYIRAAWGFNVNPYAE